MIHFRLIFFFCLFSGLVKAQNFRIQIAAFADSVNQSYFTDRGVDGVITVRGGSGIWQYVLGNYATREEAEAIQDQLIAHGFSRPVIQDLEADRVLSELNCAYTTGLVKPRDDEDSSNPVGLFFSRMASPF